MERQKLPRGDMERIMSPVKLYKNNQRKDTTESDSPSPHDFFSSFVDILSLFQSSQIDIKETNKVIKKLASNQEIPERKDFENIKDKKVSLIFGVLFNHMTKPSLSSLKRRLRKLPRWLLYTSELEGN